MRKGFVIDTNALIRYFPNIFLREVRRRRRKRLSPSTTKIIDSALKLGNIRLSIPSVVFIELFDKWCSSEEERNRIYYEVFKPLDEAENVHIQPIEQEVLENLTNISGILYKHDIHDKIILASAMMLKWPLITTDSKITEYVNKTKVIPRTLK